MKVLLRDRSFLFNCSTIGKKKSGISIKIKFIFPLKKIHEILFSRPQIVCISRHDTARETKTNSESFVGFVKLDGT